MIRSIKYVGLLLLIININTIVLSQTTKNTNNKKRKLLPKGEMKPILKPPMINNNNNKSANIDSTAKTKLNKPSQQMQIKSCHDYYSGSIDGESYIDTQKQVLYYLARFLSDNISKGYKYKYVLYEIFYQKEQLFYNKLVNIDGNHNMMLMVHDSSPPSFTFISFNAPMDWCYEGVGFGLSIPYTKQSDTALDLQIKPTKILAKGIYKILNSSQNKLIVDLEKLFIRDIDVLFSQTRTVGSFPKGEIPIYITDLSNIMISLITKPEPTIKAYNLNNKKELWTKNLNNKEKIYITEQGMAIIDYHDHNNLLLNMFYPLNQQKQISEKFNLKLVGNVDIKNMNLKINFLAKKVIISGGGTHNSRKKWDKIFIYDYIENKVTSILKIKPEHYCSNFIIDPQGKIAIFFLNKKTDDTHSSIKTFNFNTSKWGTLDIK